MIRPKPDVPERVPVISFPTPEGQSDLLFYEIRDGDVPKNKLWSYGDAHPDVAKFPNHELVFVAAEGGAGWQRWYYAANRENQHLYNWQFTDTTDWPQLAQTFIVRRSEFSVTTTYEMPPKDVIPYPLEWSATGIEERPINDEVLASTFVTVVVTREKIRVRAGDGTYSDLELVGREFDPDTNSTTSYRRSKVPAGESIPEGIQPDGSIVELQPVNTLWSIKNTKQAAGLAGKAVNGKAYRSYQIVTNWAWPAVLDYVRITKVNADPGVAYSAVTGYVTVPVYSADAYSGPCLATIQEEWTSKMPVVGGNPLWDNTMSGTGLSASPQLIPPTVMLPKSIYFDSPLLRVNVPECLHGPLTFYEGPYNQFYPATNYERWPGSVYAEVDLRPSQGGWLKKTMIVNAPSLGGVQSALVLGIDEVLEDGVPISQVFATSFKLKWNALAGTTVLNLDISTDPTFTTGFLVNSTDNFKNKSVLGTTSKLVTGASRGVTYYCRLKSSRVEDYGTPSTADDQVISVQSATLAVTCPPQPEIYLATPGTNWPSNLTSYIDLPPITGSLAFGDVQPPASLTKTIIIRNTGLVAITNLGFSFSGSDFSATGTIPTTVDPGQYEEVTVRFAPTTFSPTTRTATMTVTSNALNTPSYAVELTGRSVQPEVNVKYLGTSRLTTSVVNFADDTSARVNTGTSGVFSLTIENLGNGPLTTAVTSSDPSTIWKLDSAPSEPIPPGGSDEFTVTFTPDEAGSRTTTISIINNDVTPDSAGSVENPYQLFLTAVGRAVGKISVVAPDVTSGEPLPPGGAYNFGISQFSPSTAKTKNFTVKNIGKAPLNITAIEITQTAPNQFSFGTLSFPLTIPVDSSIELPVTFTPTSAGTKTALLKITSDDPTQLLYTASLSGGGGSAQEIQVEQPEGTSLDANVSTLTNYFVNFGSLLVGSSKTLTFWIRNVGNAQLNISSIELGGDNPSKFTLGALQASPATHLDGGQKASFDVTFNASSTGYFKATVTINSGDASEPQYIIPLNGFAHPAGSLTTGQPSAIVLGQSSATADVLYGFNEGAPTVAGGLSLHSARPAVSVSGRVAIADAGNNRVLIWNTYSALSTFKNPDVVLGQSSLTSGAPAAVSASSLSSPSAVAWFGDKLLVSDYVRSRILIWNDPQSNNQAANLVLGGQASAGASPFTASTSGCSATLNRGITDIFVVPSGVNTGKIIASDPRNYRILIWNTFPTVNVAPASVALGQALVNNLTVSVASTVPVLSFVESGVTLPRFSSSTSVCVGPDGRLYIADNSGSRVLVYAAVPTAANTPPTDVLFRAGLSPTAGYTGSYSTPPTPSSTPVFGVAVNAAGHLAVSTGEGRVLLFFKPAFSDSFPDALVGSSRFEGSAGGAPSSTSLVFPKGVTWYGGDLLVNDRNRVAIFKP